MQQMTPQQIAWMQSFVTKSGGGGAAGQTMASGGGGNGAGLAAGAGDIEPPTMRPMSDLVTSGGGDAPSPPTLRSPQFPADAPKIEPEPITQKYYPPRVDHGPN